MKTAGGDKTTKKKSSFFSDKLGTSPEVAGKENGGVSGGMVVPRPTQARKGKRGLTAYRCTSMLAAALSALPRLRAGLTFFLCSMSLSSFARSPFDKETATSLSE